MGGVQLQGAKRHRPIQLFGSRRAGGSRLLAGADRMSRRALASVAAALCLGGLPAQAQSVEDVTMALPAVGFPFTAGYIADGLNLWEKHGLRVKSIVIAGIGSTNAVISGSA